MDNLENIIENAKESMPKVTPTPPGFKPEASAHDLKARLDWGEPALTILDVRDRESFNKGHIMGAMPMPLDSLAETAQTINQARDIYIYGTSDADTAQAVTKLREAGFSNVAYLKGGLDSWKEIEGSTEGTEEIAHPGAEAYNVVSRLAHHQEIQQKEARQK
ncbi:MAG: rhodanese-like domain-containing protein [Stenomitos frigidus ULC029]